MMLMSCLKILLKMAESKYKSGRHHEHWFATQAMELEFTRNYDER